MLNYPRRKPDPQLAELMNPDAIDVARRIVHRAKTGAVIPNYRPIDVLQCQNLVELAGTRPTLPPLEFDDRPIAQQMMERCWKGLGIEPPKK